jgi:peptidoglycan hydrolase-like protein with peptidoglycan-binding domain
MAGTERQVARGGYALALKDMDVGVKILGGIVAFALLMAMMSNGDPDNDAWGAGEPVDDASADGEDPYDPWSAAPDDGAEVPACDGVAPFTTDDGTVRLPVHGPVVPFPSAVCQLGPGTGDAAAVGALQHALAACNRQALAVDGAYGADTERAVAAVQAELGLEVDGIYGPQTRVAMAWPTEGEPEPSSPCISGD